MSKIARMKTPERTEIIRAACRRFPDLPSLTLARKLFKDHRALFKNLDQARAAVRYHRGNFGNSNRSYLKDKSLIRPNQPAGFSWSFPQSRAPDYAAFQLDSPRTLILSDLHIPFHDPPAIKACIDYGRQRTFDTILLNGDICDFFSISRFEKNASEISLKSELRATRQFLGWLRQEFPKARIIYKLGNHDEWFDRYMLQKCPEFFGVDGLDLPHLLTGEVNGLPAIGGIEWVMDQKKIQAGKLTIWHGHEVGKGSIAPPVNPARGLFMRTMDCGLMGHLHKGSQHEETSSQGKIISTWSTGCLCGLWPRYARVNKWTHGAAFLELHQQSQFNVTPIRILKGRIL